MALMKKFDQHVKKYPGHAIFNHIVEEIKMPLRKETAQMMKAEKLKKPLGLQCELVAVAVDPGYGGKGIGGKLTDLCVKKAWDKGFKIAFAECSSHYSTRALEKFGAKTEHEILYTDYTFGKGCCSKGT